MIAPPPLHPGTGQPIGPGDLAPLFPMELIKQVVSQDREIEIPDPVRDVYKLYRPSPLHRARRLEKAYAEVEWADHYLRPVGAEGARLADPKARAAEQVILPWLRERWPA